MIIYAARGTAALPTAERLFNRTFHTLSMASTIRRSSDTAPLPSQVGGDTPHAESFDARPGAGSALQPSESRMNRIARRAHEIYEARGGQHGKAMEDWLKAEREIDDEIDRAEGSVE